MDIPAKLRLDSFSNPAGADLCIRLLADVGFQEPQVARGRIASLTTDSDARSHLDRCLLPLLFALSDAANPDASLVNFERYVQSVPNPRDVFLFLADHPRGVEILIKLFVGSQYLTEILLRNPDYLRKLTDHKRLSEIKPRELFFQEAFNSTPPETPLSERLGALRRYQQWELLRLGACDSFGLMDLRAVTSQLSLLADSMVQVCLAWISQDLKVSVDEFVVLGFGKLGGEELNYSSDIDLIFVARENPGDYWDLGQRLIQAVMEPMADGFLYRVDMRLRPWGNSGPLVTSYDSYLDYLRQHGLLWEKQALLKARPIAGNLQMGRQLLKQFEPLIFGLPAEQIRISVLQMKEKIEENLRKKGREKGQVKAGEGSIRDVEFVVQFLQLAHGFEQPHVRTFKTLDALVRLTDFDYLHADEFRQLTSGYICLRTIEHALQLMHNKQMHALPENPRELAYLARRLDYPSTQEFLRHYEDHCRAIRKIYNKYIATPVDQRESDSAPPSPVIEHLGHIAPDYADHFKPAEIDLHVQLLGQLSDKRLVCTHARPVDPGETFLTVVGFDVLGDLSLMCGLLTVYGFNIESGYVFTGEQVASRTPSGRPSVHASIRKYVNVFHLAHAPYETDFSELWTSYESDLAELIALAKAGRHREAQGRLAKRIAASMARHIQQKLTLLPVDIEVDNDSSPTSTILRIQAEDSLGFLYELTNALALSGVSIQQVAIQSVRNQVHDVLHVQDRTGHKITNPNLLKELRAAVILIKHFTRLLPHSPNPEQALLNFTEFLEQLLRQQGWVEQLALLQRSDVLEALAKLLGVSEFLWHDFLKVQHDNLFPVVTNLDALHEPKSLAHIRQQLANELAVANSLDRSRQILNAFKDREMLRVDMRHILNIQHEFVRFSRELTDVAEAVVSATSQFCDLHLRKQYGEPRLPSGKPCGLALCALGKCGGYELGFASDIELMFIYEGDGKTSGPQVITNLEYFQKLIDLFTASIWAKRAGIFEIDLRLRPFGKAGSPAVCLETFLHYFGPQGPAWPYERQALVKLRPIAGDPEFGYRVIQARDGILYTGAPFDILAMRAMRDRQIRQKVQPGTFNAKLSHGGLVDCEYLVQGLQITYGHLDPAFRTTNTREAMKAFERFGILTKDQRVRLRDAYRFLRRIIDALRMVRGNAKDLTVPPTDSEEFLFLARRISRGLNPSELSQELERHTANVRELMSLLDDPSSISSLAKP